MEPTTQLATGAADTLVQLLLRPENLYLMVAMYAVLTTAQKVLPERWINHPLVVRLAPLYPLVLCSAGVWVPGQQPADMSAGSKVLVGLVLGWACGHLNKVWKQTVRGKDSRIQSAVAALTGETEEPEAAAPPAPAVIVPPPPQP